MFHQINEDENPRGPTYAELYALKSLQNSVGTEIAPPAGRGSYPGQQQTKESTKRYG